MKQELVSVIMPTYNCGRFIDEAIGSVLSQTYGTWELLIVDDCSTDDTQQRVSAYEDARIRYIRLATNQGAALARNRALKEAKGRWMAFLDADDVWEPTKIERQVAFMLEHGYAFTYHEYVEIDEQSQPLGVYVSGKVQVGRLGMRSCCWPGCLTVMYDKQQVGLMQVPDIRKNNDTALWLQVIERADCYLLPECLARYRRRSGSITPASVWQKIGWHYLLFRQALGLNPAGSVWWMMVNIAGNGYKKWRYRRRIAV